MKESKARIASAEADVTGCVWQAKATLGEGATYQQQQDYVNSFKNSDMKDLLIKGQDIKNHSSVNKIEYDYWDQALKLRKVGSWQIPFTTSNFEANNKHFKSYYSY